MNDIGSRELTFEEESLLYDLEAKTLFASETPETEAPFANLIVRRGNRIIRKARTCLKRMTPNDYQIAALRTINKELNNVEQLQNGFMGLNGEAGECIDILKKHLFQGHPLDEEHIAKELGDIAWYLAVSAYSVGYDLETIFQMNIDKLKSRYPDGFDVELSIHRAKDDI